MKMKLNFSNKLMLKNDEIIQNFYQRNDRAIKIHGTNRYNHNPLSSPIKWMTRYYGITADGTFIKKMFCFSSGKIYMGDDVTGGLQLVQDGLSESKNPESVTLQVAGNSRMYVFTGDTPIYYEGAWDGTFYQSSITYKFIQGVVKDDRLWAFEKNSSTLYFSRVLYPEDFSVTYGGSLIVGNDKDSFIRRIVVLGDYIYIFKNNSIYVLTGKTKSTYQVELLVPHIGLLAQKALCHVGNSLVFVCQQDKEIYEFSGTPLPRQISKHLHFSKKIDIYKTDDMCSIWDRVNNLYRLSYNEIQSQEGYQNNEVLFPLDEFLSDGQPKWTETYGARISCYDMWDQQGDHTLVTGRSDKGYVMYHNRGTNWDDEAMECIIRTDKLMPEEGRNCQFEAFYVKGTPSDGTMIVRAYLNDRHSGRSSQDIADVGEQDTTFPVLISTQYSFNNYMPFLTGYNHGESITIEVYDKTLGKQIEIEDFVIEYTRREKVLNTLIG